MTKFDLDAYFRRIGFSGGRSPDLETLRGICLHHPQAIPFENLNPLLGWPVHLDVASLQQKLIHGGRGEGIIQTGARAERRQRNRRRLQCVFQEGDSGGPKAPDVSKPNTKDLLQRMRKVDPNQSRRYRQRTGQ